MFTTRRLFQAGLVAAAVGITATVWVSNGASIASECSVNTLAQSQMDAVAVGELAALLATAQGRGYADLSFLDAQGEPVSIADYAGKPILVNFWATWCGPCREEMPALDVLSADYGGENFEVLTINLDVGADGLNKAVAFLADNDLPNLPLLADPTFGAFERLKTEGVALGLPATLLLDSAGCELAVLQGPAPWDGEQGRAVIEMLIDIGQV